MKPKCKLTGTDGNAMSIIAKVRRALNAAGQTDKAIEWSDKAWKSGSYDELLQLAFDYVDVE